MHLTSVYVLILSCILLLSPLLASPLLPLHNSQSNHDDTGVSLSTQTDGFQQPDSPDIGENFAAEPPPPPPAYQDDILGSPPIGAPNNANTDFLPYVPSPPTPTDDITPPSIPPPPTGDAPLPSPQFPFISPPLPDNSLPISPQLPFTSPPHGNSLPESPQLPFASSPPPYNTLPGSPQSPLPYHHPKDTQPETSTTPAPFGVYPSGGNQGQQFGQTNSGQFGQQQNSNGLPFGGQYGGCGSTSVNFIEIAMTFIGVLLISWV